MKKQRVLQVSGQWDGNIFFIIGNTRRALRDAGRDDLAESVGAKATAATSYHEALGVCLAALAEAGYKVR